MTGATDPVTRQALAWARSCQLAEWLCEALGDLDTHLARLAWVDVQPKTWRAEARRLAFELWSRARETLREEQELADGSTEIASACGAFAEDVVRGLQQNNPTLIRRGRDRWPMIVALIESHLRAAEMFAEASQNPA